MEPIVKWVTSISLSNNIDDTHIFIGVAFSCSYSDCRERAEPARRHSAQRTDGDGSAPIRHRRLLRQRQL